MPDETAKVILEAIRSPPPRMCRRYAVFSSVGVTHIGTVWDLEAHRFVTSTKNEENVA